MPKMRKILPRISGACRYSRGILISSLLKMPVVLVVVLLVSLLAFQPDNTVLVVVEGLSNAATPQSSLPSASVQTVVSVDPETNQRRFMFMNQEQDDELKRLGDREAQLMSTKPGTKLKPTNIKKLLRQRSGGFGTVRSRSNANSKKSHSKEWNDEARAYAAILKSDGLVCIEDVLPSELCDNLRGYLVELRDRARFEIESGVILDSQDRFADVLLNKNRCDLKVPLGPPPVNDALHSLLASHQTVLRELIETVYESYGNIGSDATLYELNCFMSNSGARRQLVHADNVCVEDQVGLDPDEPIMLTCFVALQDVDESMGPTIFIPGTHNLEAHRQFFDTSETFSSDKTPKEQLLSSRKAVMGTLAKGSCILFDPRTLHCAGGNCCSDSNHTRALFYFSFKNPRVDFPGCPSCGGYGIPEAELTLKQLADELQVMQRSQADRLPGKLDLLAAFP